MSPNINNKSPLVKTVYIAFLMLSITYMTTNIIRGIKKNKQGCKCKNKENEIV